MRLLLLLLLACGSGEEDVPLVTESAAQSTSALVRQCLEGAIKLREEGQAEAASAAVLGCYGTHFEPMERPLRAHNRKATLSLEYEFGRVASHMSQSGSGQAANGMASRLADRLERVLATMPVAAPDTGAAAAAAE